MTTDLTATLRAARQGDQSAINELCLRLYPRVRQMVHKALASDLRLKRPWIGALFSTGDVVQDIFIGVTRDLQDIRGQSEDDLLHYIATLTRNRLVDAIRFHEASCRDRRRNLAEANAVEELGTAGPPPERYAIQQEQLERYQKVLDSFPVRDRTLLRERLENRTPFEALCRMLGYASADSTRKAFHVAQARLLLRLRQPR